MNKLIWIICFLPIWVTGQGTGTDSLKNASKVRYLKSKIDDALNPKASTSELQAELDILSNKYKTLESRFDSLLNAMEKKESNYEENAYYLVIESQARLDRAEVALAEYENDFDAKLAIVLSKSGRWNYVILEEPIPKESIGQRLSDVRKQISKAWFISLVDFRAER